MGPSQNFLHLVYGCGDVSMFVRPSDVEPPISILIWSSLEAVF